MGRRADLQGKPFCYFPHPFTFADQEYINMACQSKVTRSYSTGMYLGVLVHKATVLCLIVEGLSALEGQVEAAPVHQRHL